LEASPLWASVQTTVQKYKNNMETNEKDEKNVSIFQLHDHFADVSKMVGRWFDLR
jgi:hypothetical protein